MGRSDLAFGRSAPVCSDMKVVAEEAVALAWGSSILAVKACCADSARNPVDAYTGTGHTESRGMNDEGVRT